MAPLFFFSHTKNKEYHKLSAVPKAIATECYVGRITHSLLRRLIYDQLQTGSANSRFSCPSAKTSPGDIPNLPISG